MFLGSRGLPREPQEDQDGSQEAPKEVQNLKKTDPKMDHKIMNSWTSFGIILEPILRPKTHQKGNPKWDTFLNQFWDPRDTQA